MKHKTIRGYIRYTSKKPERLDQERGREFFTITTQIDDVVVMDAHCEIDDEPNVIRDVVVAMKKDATPLDCSVRLSVGDQFEGTGWFRFDEDEVECEMYNRKDGRITQKIKTKKTVPWLQAHPIVGDGLLMKCYDLSKGKGKQMLKDFMLTSPDHRGATGPMLFKMKQMSIEYMGEEEITVAAGTFQSRHFAVGDTAGSLLEEHPPYHVWVTADDDYLFLKASAAGYMQTHYELESIEYFNT
ncbi:DUF3108 domain-containing protein [Maribacter algarum]|uniref:DUF3108 domain-containing protein n=1 Tax=Maribacter algarum (ex Zhang et al. 2020) TaxID=2578118 RepID=A0A5S3PUQ0_9FLAO|nr:DUF3108 domain-containing protein [Maribacter algarum]TMM58638.1 DUF3108 domain-containing protein [Maribacter algarum]